MTQFTAGSRNTSAVHNMRDWVYMKYIGSAVYIVSALKAGFCTFSVHCKFTHHYNVLILNTLFVHTLPQGVYESNRTLV